MPVSSQVGIFLIGLSRVVSVVSNIFPGHSAKSPTSSQPTFPHLVTFSNVLPLKPVSITHAVVFDEGYGSCFEAKGLWL
jgi:hypothetical protein